MIGELALAVVDPEVVGHGVVGHVDVDVAVAVEVAGHRAHAAPGRFPQARPPRVTSVKVPSPLLR